MAQSDKGIVVTVDRSVIEYEDASNVYDHLLEEQETRNKPRLSPLKPKFCSVLEQIRVHPGNSPSLGLLLEDFH